MVRHASLFSQVLSLVNRHHFASCVKELEAEKHAKGFTCWGQFGRIMGSDLKTQKCVTECACIR